ncbi:MAG TPA: rhomboid family intramembrane serine protease [Candidatus Kapabacteria bacterium]|nr:rhomboid family intramembrane serine protease [Candidatus Kapabacteria bacterium]
MFRNLPPLCKYLIIALVASALLSLAIPSLTVSVLPLFPQLLWRGQIWRLVTYPFFVLASIHGLLASIFTLLWNGILIAMFGGELETIVHTKRLLAALAGAVIVGGILFSLLSPGGALAGPGILTMFLLGGFSYLWPKREISIFGLFWVKAWMIALAVYILSIIPMSGMELDTSAANLFGPTFGAFAAIAYFHIAYRQYDFGRAFLNRSEDLLQRKRGRRTDTSDPKSVEVRIDSILDKIASTGMQSLSKEEREFLLKHSK